MAIFTIGVSSLSGLSASVGLVRRLSANAQLAVTGVHRIPVIRVLLRAARRNGDAGDEKNFRRPTGQGLLVGRSHQRRTSSRRTSGLPDDRQRPVRRCRAHDGHSKPASKLPVGIDLAAVSPPGQH